MAQTIDVHLHQVRLRIKVDIPNVFDDIVARHRIRGAAQEKFEQREFPGGKRNRTAGTSHAPLMPVHLDVRVAKQTPAAVEPSNQRAHASEQFGDGERLGQVVIGAGIKAFDSLFDKCASREHKNGSVDARAAKYAANLDAAQARQSDVEHDAVVRNFSGQLERLLAVLRKIHGVRVFPKRAANNTCYTPLVFHQEYSHVWDYKASRGLCE